EAVVRPRRLGGMSYAYVLCFATLAHGRRHGDLGEGHGVAPRPDYRRLDGVDRGLVRRRDLEGEVVELHHVLYGHLPALLGRALREDLTEDLLRVREDGVAVGVVVAPEHGLRADEAAGHDA